MEDQTIGQRVRELRLYYKMSIYKFANCCGLTHVAIFNIERGKTETPRAYSLNRIIDTFGTTQQWLLYSIEPMLPNGRVTPSNASNKVGQGFVTRKDYIELKNKYLKLEEEINRIKKELSIVDSLNS
jgi:transcriptional regulator with XRE-family HTH domain